MKKSAQLCTDVLGKHLECQTRLMQSYLYAEIWCTTFSIILSYFYLRSIFLWPKWVWECIHNSYRIQSWRMFVFNRLFVKVRKLWIKTKLSIATVWTNKLNAPSWNIERHPLSGLYTISKADGTSSDDFT